MATWTRFPCDNTPYVYDAQVLKRLWPRLHACDAEPLPDDDRVLAAWRLFHAGAFQEAVDAGLQAGGAGITVANKAQAVYAHYLEPSEPERLRLLLEVVARADDQAHAQPRNANAYYLMAYALGRYCQRVNAAKVRAQGLDDQARKALETAIALEPRHADAHVALGVFHAEAIDRVGKPSAKAQGADVGAGLRMFRRALELDPTSPIARIEYANGLVMLQGRTRLKESERLYAEAAACAPMDAKERLDVEGARAELED